jgi:LysM repeat protein
MNRRIADTALFLAVAAVFILVSGCTRPMSSGPIPTPGSAQAQSIIETPTPEGGIPTAIVATTVAGATATVAGATEQPTVAPVVTTPVPTTASTPAPSGGQTSYTVKPGDRLFSIGRQFGVNPYTIAQVNHIGPPYILYPGQVLTIPAGGTGVPTGGTYTVQSGDTIYSIGRKLGKSPIAIINANNLISPNRIFPGMVLKIP